MICLARRASHPAMIVRVMGAFLAFGLAPAVAGACGEPNGQGMTDRPACAPLCHASLGPQVVRPPLLPLAYFDGPRALHVPSPLGDPVFHPPRGPR